MEKSNEILAKKTK